MALAQISHRRNSMIKHRPNESFSGFRDRAPQWQLFGFQFRAYSQILIFAVVMLISVLVHGTANDSGGQACRDLIVEAEQNYLDVIRQARWMGNFKRGHDGIPISSHIDFGIQNWEKADLANSQVAAQIFDLYAKTYKDFGLVLSNSEDLAKKRIALVLRDGDKNIVAFQLARYDHFGILLTQVGGDGSRFARIAILQLLQSRLPEGVYLQTAGVPLRVISKTHLNPVVPFQVARVIRQNQGREIRALVENDRRHAVEHGDLLNEDEILSNGYVTTVRYGGKVQEVFKVMIGRPLLENARLNSR